MHGWIICAARLWLCFLLCQPEVGLATALGIGSTLASLLLWRNGLLVPVLLPCLINLLRVFDVLPPWPGS